MPRGALAAALRGARRRDGEAGLRAAGAAVAPVGARGRGGGAGARAARDGAVALLHVRPAVALVGADGARTTSTRGRVRERARAFQLAEYGVLVCKQVADQPVGVAFVHR